MRTAWFIALLTLAWPAAATGLWAGHFDPAWSALPSTHFSPWTVAPTGRVLSVHASSIPSGVLSEALASAEKTIERRDIAVNEIAQGWDPARRSALEDLRDAQRGFVAVAGGDAEARGQRFMALLKQVVDHDGRSVAREPSDADAALGQTYDRVIRDAPDDRLAPLQASESAWEAYRDAFDRFAISMDRPDAANTIRKELAHQRAQDLDAEVGH